MDTVSLLKNLNQLEEIAENPNAKNGVWNSLSLFISISDKLLENIKDFDVDLIPQTVRESIIRDLENVRSEFEKLCDIKLEARSLGRRYERARNGSMAHKFRSKIFNFLKGYQGHFLIVN